MAKLFIDRFTTFNNSLNSLMRVNGRDLTDEFVLSGTIQKFSNTFDLSWKVLKDILVQELAIVDFALGSPREVLKKSYENKLIDDDNWMEMLRARNNLAHDYDGNMAEEAVKEIIDTYIPLLDKFRNMVKEKYINT